RSAPGGAHVGRGLPPQCAELLPQGAEDLPDTGVIDVRAAGVAVQAGPVGRQLRSLRPRTHDLPLLILGVACSIRWLVTGSSLVEISSSASSQVARSRSSSSPFLPPLPARGAMGIVPFMPAPRPRAPAPSPAPAAPRPIPLEPPPLGP